MLTIVTIEWVLQLRLKQIRLNAPKLSLYCKVEIFDVELRAKYNCLDSFLAFPLTIWLLFYTKNQAYPGGV